MTLSTSPVSLTREGWEREAPEPSYRGDGTSPNPARMWGMGNQHQSMGPAGSKMGLYRFMDWTLKNRDYRDKTERCLLLPVTGILGTTAMDGKRDHSCVPSLQSTHCCYSWRQGSGLGDPLLCPKQAFLSPMAQLAGCSSPHHSMSTAPGPQATHPYCCGGQEPLVCVSRGGWTTVIIHATAAALSAFLEFNQVRCFFSLCHPPRPTPCSFPPVCHSQ